MPDSEDLLCIDGSIGEGGGQILRTSLSLSLITGRSVRLSNIRVRRGNPGLRRQHLTAVRAAAAVGRASVEGAEIGSRDLVFRPRGVFPGEYALDVGTAGSTTLVLQTLLPPLALAARGSAVKVSGGTHNHGAPPFEYIARVFLPLVRRMGVCAEVSLLRHGFYPRGGGQISAVIRPASSLSPLDLPERGALRRVRAVALLAGLPRHIARRELEVVRRSLGWHDDELNIEEIDPACGPGNCLMLEIESEHVTELFTAFGRLGVPAETVAREAVAAAHEYLESDAAVGPYLADQLLLPVALAGTGRFSATTVSGHAETNMHVIRHFLDVEFDVAPHGRGVMISVHRGDGHRADH